MKLLCIGTFLLCVLRSSAQQPLQPLGLWREHLPYNSAIDVTAGDNQVFCATPYSIFVVKLPGQSIERWSRVTGLSETGISTIKYDEVNKKLFIAYLNSNIDLVDGDNIINIPDVKQDNIIGDKTIYAIYPLGNKYYLSTGLGVIVIDGEKKEVQGSWFIGNGGNQVKVNGFSSDAAFFYAATDEGLKKISITASNPTDYSQWQVVSTLNGLSAGPVKNVLNVQGKMIIEKNDSLFAQSGASWSFFYTGGWPILKSNSSQGKITVCERQSNGASRVRVLNSDGTIAATYSQPSVISFPLQAILFENSTWIADRFGGLSKFNGSSFEQFKPNSPEATASGEMQVYNKIFYATAGEVNDSWNYQYNGNGIYIFKEGEWTNINRFRYPQIDTLFDYITIAIDKTDESIWAGSYGGGLLHIKPGPVFEIFKQGFLGPAIGDPGSYRVAGLTFDHENNLWISNYGAPAPLVVRKKDGSWKSFSVPFTLTENAMAQIINDANNYKWIVSPKGNGLICYDPGASIDNTGDDRWKLYRAGAGNGNLPSSEVTSIAIDKSGFIWVGTTDGIGVIYCPELVFTSGCEAVWPVVQEGNFANYLFKGQEIRSIAVDGADRKWVATRSGVWLISPAGDKIIYQFTESNSPLLSNDVKKITIDGESGEVYFATMKGISSFRSTATEGLETNKGLLIFPNPVPPGYAGTIAIRGLVNNARVKITELNGRLVHQSVALGGQAIWDGRDYKGRRISSGVYLVLVSDADQKEKAAGKIIFLSR